MLALPLILFRLAGLAARYLLAGDAPLGARVMLFAPAAAAHVGTLLVIVALFLAAARLVPARRGTIVVAASLVFAVLMIAGQADFTVSSITGAPLTPTVFRTYRGLHVVKSKEFLEPLRANLATTVGGTAAFAGLVAWIVAIVGRARAARTASPVAPAAIGALLLVAAAIVPWPTPPPPIEVAFAREYLHLDRVTIRGSEADAIASLRGLVGLPPGAVWVDDAYPLVYQPPHTAVSDRRRADLPDIVVVMIESLRAEELPVITGTGASVTPNLDALAARSVVFPTYISNAFPSAPSVLSFHCSAWPHRRKEIMTDFSSQDLDCLPPRLASLGYDTLYVGADPHFDHQDVWLGRWYAKAVDLVAEGTAGTDRNIVSRALDEIARHDAADSARPLFAFVSTYSTHYPFTLPDDAGEAPLSAAEPLRARYRQTLGYTDRQLGRLMARLRERPRRTVTIVLGDHAFYVDLKRISGVPENDNVWTPAIVNGPEDLVGAPRRVVTPASHVDMQPSLLAMVGDARPTASLGRDLFGGSRSREPFALAVRAGGIRLDRRGESVVVDARMPNVATVRVPFPALLPADERQSAAAGADVLVDWVNDWSYLIERNRVWAPRLIQGTAGGAERSSRSSR